MLKLILIRHSLTQGNLSGRYIGTTDEPLCQEGIERLKNLRPPKAQQVYMSPMKRCTQTARYLYPGIEKTILEDLRECDFGDFENKNYKELDGNQDYQAWIDSQGTLPFPNGESHEQFRKRCCCAFELAVEDALRRELQSAAFVIHGGTVMSIMEQYARPQRCFYDWQIENAGGILAEAEQKIWMEQKKILFLERWPE